MLSIIQNTAPHVSILQRNVFPNFLRLDISFRRCALEALMPLKRLDKCIDAIQQKHSSGTREPEMSWGRKAPQPQWAPLILHVVK